MKKDLRDIYDGTSENDGTILGTVESTVCDNAEAIDPLEEKEAEKK